MAGPLDSTMQKKFLEYVAAASSPFHAVGAARDLLQKAGFSRILETEFHRSLLRPGGRYYITRNHSTLMAFIVGKRFNPLNDGGVVLVAAHTDSPCLKLRSTQLAARADIVEAGAFVTSCETYGGGLWHTWLDRGLGIAGKVVVSKGAGDVLESEMAGATKETCKERQGSDKARNAAIEERLIRVSEPLMFIPNLAIHLQSAEERSALKLNRDKHLRPLVATTLNVETSSPLFEAVASAAGVANQEDIVSFNLCLMDVTEPRVFGTRKEFIEAPRLDNLTSCWAAIEALSQLEEKDVEKCEDLLVVAAFDHEEIGSQSVTGAGSTLCETWLRRILRGTTPTETVIDEDLFLSVGPRSFVISADAAHAVHPNYSEKHQSPHMPLLGRGVVVKHNVNQRYATECTTAALLTATMERSEEEDDDKALQHFSVANESPCGSTIGPILAAHLGFRTVDVGIPLLGMHSIREVCAARDVVQFVKFLRTLFVHFRDVDRSSSYI